MQKCVACVKELFEGSTDQKCSSSLSETLIKDSNVIMAHFLQRLLDSDVAQGLSSKKGLLIALVLGALLCLAAAGAVVKLNAAAAAACATNKDNSSSSSSTGSDDGSGGSGGGSGGDAAAQQLSPPINPALTTGMFALACVFAAYSAALCTFAARASKSSK